MDQLYCSHNGIEVLEGLDNNVKLQTLDMAVNKIKKIENISHLTDLEEFWVSFFCILLLPISAFIYIFDAYFTVSAKGWLL